MVEQERDELPRTTDRAFYTPKRVEWLLMLLPYYTDSAPQVRWEKLLVHGGRRWVNSQEWWWGVRGELLGALDKLGELPRQVVEACVIGQATHRDMAPRLGISIATISRIRQQALEDMAYMLGWEGPVDDDESEC